MIFTADQDINIVISGKYSETLVLDGKTANTFEADGELSVLTSLDGDLSSYYEAEGDYGDFKGVSHEETYRGSYTVTPKCFDDVTLSTNGFVMADDVTVYQITYIETSNTDGTTVYIGAE